MKILMLLSNPYLPDARVYREAKSLTANGHTVTVLAWDRERNRPEEEIMEGIKVIRTGPKARGKRHFLSDIRKFWKNALRISESLEFDVVHANDFDTLPLAVKIKKKRKAPIVFDAHEIYSEMIRLDVPSFVASFVQLLEDRHLKKVDRVIVVNEYQFYFYSKRLPKERIVIIMNAKPALKDAKKAAEMRKRLGLEGKISLIYIGALEPKRFVRELADFAGKLPDVKVIIGGYGSQREYIAKKAEKNESLIYLGLVHPDDVIPYSAAADMIVAMYKEVQTDRIATKFFDAVSAGRGLLVADNGELTADLVRKYKGGIICEYSPESFEKAVRSLDREKIDSMGRNMAKLRERYSWDAMEKRLISLYESISPSREVRR